MPATTWLGLSFGPRDAQEARVSLEPRLEHERSPDVLHGGVVAALADTAAVHLLLPEVPEAVTSIDFKLDFLQPATRSGGPLEATARLVRLGRRVAVADVEVTQAGAACARGLFTYLLVPDPPRRP